MRLAADEPLLEQAFGVASEVLAGRGMTAAASLPEEADVIVSAAPPDDGDALAYAMGYWVPVVRLSHRADELSFDQLGGAVSGETRTWASITGDELPLRVIVPLERPPPFDQWWPGNIPSVETAPLESIPEILGEDAGALAIMPLDAVDARLRSLAVDGTNIVFGTGDTGSYAPTERAWITTRDVEDGRFASVLGEVAIEIAKGVVVPPPDPVILRATGDILPVRCTYEKIAAHGDWRRPFEELGPWLRDADVTVGSLDAAVSDAGVPFGCVETFSLMGPAAAVDGFAYAGFDVITVATNHVKDCGQSACGDESFFETLANLRNAGIAPVGGGADLSEARAPAVVTAGGLTFAFLAYDEIAPYYHAEPGVPGTAPLHEAYVREDVAAAAAQADVVVVLPQWGVEYTADPTENQRALARAAAEAGAGLVIGNHPHWVQAAEVIDGVFVAYALGNFLFDQDWSIETQQGVVLEASFHGQTLRGVRYEPIRIVDEQLPVFADDAEASQILDRIWDASSLLN